MKTMPFTGPVNLQLLTEELFDAFPEWLKPDPLGRGMATDVTVTDKAVTFPDETDEKRVEKVLRKHAPGKDSINQARERRRALKRASARDKLRALGLDDEEIDVLRNGVR